MATKPEKIHFPDFPNLPNLPGLTAGEVRHLLDARQPAELKTFEHRQIDFAACSYYTINKPIEVNYHPVCAHCYGGHAHTILEHFQRLMSAAVFAGNFWKVVRETEHTYRAKEEAWWNEHVPGHPWKPEYSLCPRW
jgi:hypothetical protein